MSEKKRINDVINEVINVIDISAMQLWWCKQQHSSESFMQMCQNIAQSPDLLFKLP